MHGALRLPDCGIAQRRNAILLRMDAHRLARDGNSWKILVKQINLIDCDQNLRNPSLLL